MNSDWRFARTSLNGFRNIGKRCQSLLLYVDGKAAERIVHILLG
jgi:hypothetical protein